MSTSATSERARTSTALIWARTGLRGHLGCTVPAHRLRLNLHHLVEEGADVGGDVAQLVAELVSLGDHGVAETAHHVTHQLWNAGCVLWHRG